MISESRKRLVRCLLVLVLSTMSLGNFRGTAQERTASALTADGAALFKLHCASSYCHGEVGKGGGAPELNGRQFDPDRLQETIGRGIPGTAMPAFGSRFSGVEIAGLVEYVRSLGGNALTGSEVIRRTPLRSDEEREREFERTLSPEAERGRQLFFDASSVGSCRTCHTFQGRGGRVGPDLSDLGERDDEAIRRSIREPAAHLVTGFEKLQIVTRDGMRFVGVRRDEDDTRLRLFDTSTMPPVSRSLLKSEIRVREVLAGSVMPDQTSLSEEQVRDLIAFLKNR